MMKTKRKFVERLDPDEALVVAPLEFWDSVISFYELYAKEDPQNPVWLESADFVRRWVAATSVTTGDEYED